MEKGQKGNTPSFEGCKHNHIIITDGAICVLQYQKFSRQKFKNTHLSISKPAYLKRFQELRLHNTIQDLKIIKKECI